MMDRRTFVQSLVALGLLPLSELEALAPAEPFPQPKPLTVFVEFTEPLRAVELTPYSLTMRHEPIEVTSWDDNYRRYAPGQISFDLELPQEDGDALRLVRIGDEVALTLRYNGQAVPCGRTILTCLSCFQPLSGDRRYEATFVSLEPLP